MKHLFKLMMCVAFGAFMLAACDDDEKQNVTPQKPEITAEMYSVTANAETGEVAFKFTGNGLSPFWTVVDPAGAKTTFTDREVTKTYTIKGNYTGNLIAYGDGGQSDPVEFSFTIGVVDPDLSATENLLVSVTWKIRYYGWCGPEGDDFWDYHEKAPAHSADDRMTFKKGGEFVLNLGEDTVVYNDDYGWVEDMEVSANPKWAYVKEGELEFIQFSDGGFPGMLGGDAAVNAKYQIKDLAADSFSLYYQQTEEQWFYVTLVPEYFEEPAVEWPTAEATTQALSGKTFKVSDYGWWGEGWQYFAVSDGEEELPLIVTNDSITFGADGSLTITLGVDDPLEEGGESAARIYNDGVSGGEVYVVEGSPKWSVAEADGVAFVQFADGGFPLMLAGDGDDPASPNYHLGLNAKWTVTSIVDGTVRLDIYQDFNEQWLTVFLSPVE